MGNMNPWDLLIPHVSNIFMFREEGKGDKKDVYHKCGDTIEEV